MRYSQHTPEDAKQEVDGTWTVTLSPWSEEPITGIPNKELAHKILDVAHEAMEECARNAMTEG